VAIADELRAAVGGVTGVRRVAQGVPREAQVGGLVFYPLIGAAIGLAAVAALRLAAPLGPRLAAVIALVVLAAASGGRTLAGLAGAAGALATRGGPSAVLARLRARPTTAGIAVAAAVFLVKSWALLHVPEAARPLALTLAPMLGRWAVVVQCYGGSPAAARGLAAVLVGRARLREFGWASALVFAATLAVLDAVGLLVLLGVTLATVALRVLAYRRAGGLTGRLLAASAETIETVTLVVLALLARG